MTPDRFHLKILVTCIISTIMQGKLSCDSSVRLLEGFSSSRPSQYIKMGAKRFIKMASGKCEHGGTMANQTETRRNASLRLEVVLGQWFPLEPGGCSERGLHRSADVG